MSETIQLPPINVTIEEAGVARKRIHVEIPQERVAVKLKEAYGELHRDATLPGFRKGRVPQRLLEKKFGGALKDEVRNKLLMEAYDQALTDNKLEVLGDPDAGDVSKLELPTSGPLKATLEVDVMPEFTLPNLEAIEVKKPKLEANQERLDKAINNLREYFAKREVITGAGAAEGDILSADIKATLEDNTVLLEKPKMWVPVRSQKIAGVEFTDFGTKLTGKTVGETITVEAIAPDTHDNADVKGKKVTVSVTILEIRRETLPEFNDDFAKQMGFENTTQVTDELKTRLVSQLETETQTAVRDQVSRYLLNQVNISLPAQLSQRQEAAVLRRKATELINRGVKQEDIAANLDQLRMSASTEAVNSLRLNLIFTRLARDFDVSVSEGELNNRIYQISAMYGRKPEKLREEMREQGQLESLYMRLRDEKVADKILEKAKVVEVDEATYLAEFAPQAAATAST